MRLMYSQCKYSARSPPLQYCKTYKNTMISTVKTNQTFINEGFKWLHAENNQTIAQTKLSVRLSWKWVLNLTFKKMLFIPHQVYFEFTVGMWEVKCAIWTHLHDEIDTSWNFLPTKTDEWWIIRKTWFTACMKHPTTQ